MPQPGMKPRWALGWMNDQLHRTFKSSVNRSGEQFVACVRQGNGSHARGTRRGQVRHVRAQLLWGIDNQAAVGIGGRRHAEERVLICAVKEAAKAGPPGRNPDRVGKAAKAWARTRRVANGLAKRFERPQSSSMQRRSAESRERFGRKGGYLLPQVRSRGPMCGKCASNLADSRCGRAVIEQSAKVGDSAVLLIPSLKWPRELPPPGVAFFAGSGAIEF